MNEQTSKQNDKLVDESLKTMPIGDTSPTKETFIKQITTHTTALATGIIIGFVIAKYLMK